MTLLMSLAFIIFASIVLAALVQYAQVSNRSVRGYREQRDERYAGDGAVKAAVNWARYQSLPALDLAVAAGTPCLYVRAANLGTVTVSCTTRGVGGPTGPEGVRQLSFVACLQTGARRTSAQPCLEGVDRILTEAGVDVANHMGRSPNVATIRSWDTAR